MVVRLLSLYKYLQKQQCCKISDSQSCLTVAAVALHMLQGK